MTFQNNFSSFVTTFSSRLQGFLRARGGVLSKGAAVTLASAGLLAVMPVAHATLPGMPGVSQSTAAAVASATGMSAADTAQYRLHLRHLHTGETLDVVYKIGNTYLPGALAELNHFLRDHRTEDASHYDPREFDVLHALLAKLHDTNGEIDVVCGYRTPWSNNFLRTGGGHKTPAQTGVAQNSQHIQAKAIDIRIPGESTRQIRDAALSLHAGGVGYYPRSQFVHVDVGPVRQWTFNGAGDGM